MCDHELDVTLNDPPHEEWDKINSIIDIKSSLLSHQCSQAIATSNQHSEIPNTT